MVAIPPELRHKLSPELIKALEDPGSPVRVMVEFFDIPSSGLERFFKETFKADVSFRSTTTPQMSMTVSEDEVPRIATMGNVKKIWHVPTVRLQAQRVTAGELLSLTFKDTMSFIRVPELRRFGLKGDGVKIGIVDSGVDKTHPMLLDSVVEEKHFIGDSPGDLVGHGTWVAGCAVGRPWEGIEGVAPEAKLVNSKIFDRDDTTIDIAMAGLEWAASRCQVVNGSWGGPPYEPLASLIRSLKSKFGTVFVFAAGNSGTEGFGYPGGYLSVAAVGSVAVKKPRPDQVASFSSRGPALGGIKPDIVAPGGSEEECVEGPAPDGGLACFRGTSMATPHVAGVVALLMKTYEGERSVRAVYNGALDIGLPGKDNDSGFGRTDASNALLAGGGRRVSPGLLAAIIGGAVLGVTGMVGLSR